MFEIINGFFGFSCTATLPVLRERTVALLTKKYIGDRMNHPVLYA